VKPVDQACEQLRRANPVPNPAALLTQLAEAADTQRERKPMTTTVTTHAKKPTPTRKTRGWTVGLTAAVVTLILGVGTVLLTTGEGPFAGGPSPVEVAEAYIEARNDYDVDRARNLLAEDFTTTEAPYGHRGHETLDLVFQSWRIWGFEFTDVSCEEVSEGLGGSLVRCKYLWNTSVTEAGGFPPSEATLQLLIQDGLIHRVSETETGLSAWWETFVSFLEAESPDDFGETVYRAVEFLDPDAVQKTGEELPAYLDLYSEWLEHQEG
jgi:hypothetical protein